MQYDACRRSPHLSRLGLGLAGALSLLACSDDPTAPAPEPSPEALAEIDVEVIGATSAVTDSIMLEFVTRETGTEATLIRTVIAEGDVGSVQRFDESMLADFAVAAAALTNGTNDYVEFTFDFLPGGGGLRGDAEEDWLEGGLTGERRPDLAGTTITHALLILDEVSLETPGRDPNGDGDWTEIELRARIVLFGET